MSINVQETNITSEKRGYRRGLILGLTMAESMLLLVFCLLLAAGAMLAKERRLANEAIADRDDLKEQTEMLEAQLDQLQKKLKKNEQDLIFLQEKVKDIPSFEAPTVDEWRELEIAREQIKKLEEAEIELAEILENVDVVKTVLEEKMTVEDINTMTESVAKLKTIKEDNSVPTEEELDAIAKVSKTLIEHTKDTVVTLTDALDELIRKAALAVESDGPDKPHEWPPIINLSETDRYFFESGSAQLNPDFEELLISKIAPQIADTATKYEVDIIEVIGHTDEQRMGRKQSNLDEEIQNVLSGKAEAAKLQAADNAGLGLSRAIAVSEVLKRGGNLKQFTILPMSGAQLIMPGDNLADGSQSGDVPSRRRIEIRVRKRNDVSLPAQKRLGGDMN